MQQKYKWLQIYYKTLLRMNILPFSAFTGFFRLVLKRLHIRLNIRQLYDRIRPELELKAVVRKSHVIQRGPAVLYFRQFNRDRDAVFLYFCLVRYPVSESHFETGVTRFNQAGHLSSYLCSSFYFIIYLLQLLFVNPVLHMTRSF